MRKIYILLLILLFNFISNNIFSQAASSCSALATTPNSQICTGATDNVITGTTPDGGTPTTNWGCLSTRPRQSWYYFQVQTSGSLNVNITNTPSTDYDAAIWGPVAGNNIGNACTATQSAPKACNYAVTTTNVLSANNINGGVTAGQIYVLVVTNFSNVAGTITISTSGTAAVNASPQPPTSVTTSANNYCFSSPPSSINLSATGGSAGSGTTSINWYKDGCGTTLVGTTGFGTSLTVTPAPTTTTTYFANYSNTCGGTTCIPITVTVKNPQLSLTGTNVTCNGLANGTITASTTGATSPYTYTINPGGSSNTTGVFAALSPNTYTITTSDAGGCSTTGTIVITQPATLTSTISSTNVSCNAGTNGTATVTPSGGTSPYTYAWSPSGGSSSSASGLAAGTYTATITDSKGCTVTRTTTITQPTTLTSTISSTNVSCNGGNNGTATLNPTGGTGPYTYSWTPGSASSITATGLTATTYTATITDANNCSITRTVTITQPATALSATISSPTNITCNGAANGTANVTAGGGTSPYTYSWSPSGGSSTSATGLAPNTYTATVTDANGCIQTTTVTITQPTLLSNTVSAPAIVCANATTTLTSSASGGTSPYQYSNNGGAYQTTNTFTVGVGTYTITAKDANNCTSTSIITLNATDAIPPVITCPSNVSQPATLGSCNKIVTGINATVTDNCIVQSVSYAITGATNATSPTTGINNASGITFAVGTSTVVYTATDNNGNASSCSFTVTITDNQIPTFTCPSNVTINATTGSCNVVVNNINAPATDNCGILKVTYVITGATNISSPSTGINDASGTTFNVGTSSITYTATDVNGNTATCLFSVIVNDTQLPTITCPSTVTKTANPNVCYATNVNLGTPTTTDNCGVNTVVATLGGNAITSTTQFPFGNSTVTWTVTDVNGNINTCTQTVNITDNQNPTITCPSNVIQNTTTNSCTKVVTGINATVSDNCTIHNITYSITGVTTATSPTTGLNDASGTVFNVGVSTVNYTVTDASNNTSTCSFTVTISDNQNPTITCPADVTQVATIGSCGKIVTGINAIVNDNCTVEKVTYSISGATSATSATTGLNDASGVLFNVGTSTVNYVVTDVSGNSTNCSFTVTITDSQNPSLTCPSDKTVAANSVCQAVVNNISPINVSDNCGVQSIAYSISGATTATGSNDASGNTFNLGVNTVSYTVTDIHGNITNCNFTVTVNDSTKPTIICPPTQTINLAATGCTATMPNYTTAATKSDNCSSGTAIVVTQTPAAGTALTGVGTIPVKLIATDAAGNKDSCTFNVIKVNTNPPLINCINALNLTLDVNCSAVLPNYTSLITSSDVCNGTSGVTIVQTPASGTIVSGTGTLQLKFVATDASNNKDSCFTTLTKLDVTDPIITCPSSQNLSLGATCTALLPNYTSLATVSDACTPTANIVITQNPVSGTTVSGSGPITISLTATDSSGNSATCSFTVNKIDNTNPTITCPSTVNTIADIGDCFATNVNIGTPTTADNCGVSTVIPTVSNVVVTSSTQFPIGTTTVLWTITDINGNTATCNQNVVVADNQNPVITCPANVTVNSNTGVCYATNVNIGTPTTSDNCLVSTVFATLAGQPVTSTTQFPVGISNILWTVTDNQGNNATCTQLVTVNDTEIPIITCPSAITVNANIGSCFATNVTLNLPVTSDNCGVSSINAVYAGSAVTSTTQFPVGTSTVLWTVIDIHGNSNTCTQNVIVIDNQNPTIICPANVNTVTNIGVCYADNIILNTPTTSDNCGISSVVPTVGGLTFTATTQLPVGTTAVTWTVTDIHGNTATCTQNVVVTDNQNPSITCPSNVTINANTGLCYATNINLGTPTTTDNCLVSSVTSTLNGVATNALTQYPVGTSNVLWTVTDNHGNTSTCIQTITIEDNELPTITCPSTLVVSSNINQCFATNVSLGTPSTNDNCGISTTLATLAGAPITSATSFPVGNSTVTWTVTDIHGNMATCNQIVTVEDNQIPTITCPSNINIIADAGVCYATNVNLGTPTTSDNCGISTISSTLGGSTITSSTPFPVGTSTVNWVVTDIHGNVSSCTQTVVVSDNENPTIICPADVTANANLANCFATNVNIGTPTINDNCGISTSVATFNGVPVTSSTSFPVGSNFVTWTVTDIHGNVSSCNQDITIVDNEIPSITCPATLTINNTSNFCYATNVNFAIPITSDNCSVNNVVATVAGIPVTSSTTFPIGTTTVTWTATDIHGNTNTCTQDIIVNDVQNPSITCPNDVIVNTDAGVCTAVINNINAVTTDNCGIDKVVYTISGATNLSSATTGINDASGLIFNKGVSTVAYSVTDTHGNISNCSFTVTVNDTENPTITCPANVVTSASSNCDALVTNIAPIVINDNCSIASVTYAINGVTTSSGVNDASNTIFNLGLSTVTYTITDASGNSTTCNFTVNVNDNTSPTINCPPTQTINLSGGCTITLPDYTSNATINDNCTPIASISLIQTPAPGTLLTGTGTIQVTLVATDANNNKDSCVFDVIKVNTTAPIINCIGQQDVYLGNSCTAVLPNYSSLITSSDVCIGTTGVTITQNPLPGTILNGAGTETITFTAVDASGNTSTCTTTINKIDTIAPAIICPPIQAIYLNGNCESVLPNFIPLATVTDNCNAYNQITITQVPAAGTTVSNSGTIDIDLFATDLNGNTSTCNFKINKLDTILPNIICPTNISIAADAGACSASSVVLGTPTTTDNCGIATLTNDALSNYPIGTTSVTWTVTDINGNINSCIQNVIVTDNEKPIITCPGNIALATDIGMCSTVVNSIGSITSDNCGVQKVTYQINGATNISSSSVGINDASGTIFTEGISMVKYIVTDIHGNIDSCEFEVKIIDNELPTITCQSNIIAYANNSCDAIVTGIAPTVNDNCGIDSTVFSTTGATVVSGINDASGTTFAKGITTITYTTTDIHGNLNSCSFTVTVLDTTKPILNCPPTQQLNLNVGCSFTLPDYTSAAFISDNCTSNANLLITQSPAAGSIVTGTGILPITITVEDESGNITSCTFDVNKVNNIPPNINCIAAQNLQLGVNCSANLPDYTSLITYSDVCIGAAGVTLTQSPTPNTIVSGTGTETVTFTAIDASGNSNSCSIIVTKIDTTSPVITCPADITAYVNGTCGYTIPALTPTATDGCSLTSQIVFTQSPAAGTVINDVGVYIINQIATDTSGNQSICSSTITVLDTIKPVVIGCPTNGSSSITLCADNTGNAVANWIEPTSTENCGTVSKTSNYISGQSFPIGVTPVTYTFEDQSGNISTCIFNVVVNEVPNVVITNPACGNPVDITSAAVTAGSSSGLTFTYYTDTNYTTIQSNANAIYSAGLYGIEASNGNCISRAPVEVIICGFPLPIELLYFSGYKTNTTDYLYWATAKEINNSHFNLQKSTDKSSFATIGTIPTKAFGGNSSNTLTYSFDDINPVIGNNYYRLEQIDINGRKTYSHTVNIVWNTDGKEQWTIYPNPAKNTINIDLLNSNASEIKIKLLDVSGKVIQLTQAPIINKSKNTVQLDINALAKGIYFVQIYLDGEIKDTQKIEKVND